MTLTIGKSFKKSDTWVEIVGENLPDRLYLAQEHHPEKGSIPLSES